MEHLTHENGTFAPGTLIGKRWRVLEVIDSHSEGAFYAIFDYEKKIKCCAKTFERKSSGNSKLRRELESDIALKLQHPNIVHYRETFEHEGILGLVSDFSYGGSLFQLLERTSRLRFPEAWRMLEELARGLSYLHEMGAIHRNLNPKTIQLSSANQIRISDFGQIKIAHSNTKITGTLDRVGDIFLYTDPNYLKTGESSFYQDVYSYGVIATELAIGMTPTIKVPEDSDKYLEGFRGIDTSVLTVERCFDWPQEAIDLIITCLTTSTFKDGKELLIGVKRALSTKALPGQDKIISSKRPQDNSDSPIILGDWSSSTQNKSAVSPEPPQHRPTAVKNAPKRSIESGISSVTGIFRRPRQASQERRDWEWLLDWTIKFLILALIGLILLTGYDFLQKTFVAPTIKLTADDS